MKNTEVKVKENTVKKTTPLSIARENPMEIDFENYIPQKPKSLGTKIFENYNLESLIPFIDWKMFFYTWEIKGKYPEILELENRKGEEARRIYNEGKQMLDDMIKNNKVKAKAVVGLFPAARKDDDILIYKDDTRQEVIEVMPMLRQQQGSSKKQNYISISDYLAPADSGFKDYLGFFAVSTGFGADEQIKKFKEENDTYNSVMFRLLCDRLTEAFSEKLHYEVRKEHWGYAQDEIPDITKMLGNRFKGIRPAPGYPPCPDHRLKAKIFNLMNVEENIDIKLTNSYAMHPASSECGCYFAHPDSKYFSVGKINKDQVLDYAERQNIPSSEVETLFRPYLNYTPNE